MKESNIAVKELSHQFSNSLVALPLEPILLSWSIEAHSEGLNQLAYEIEISSHADFSESVSSGMIKSSDQIEIGSELLEPKPRKVYFCRVRVDTELGTSRWSDTLRIEFGIPHEELSAEAIRTDSLHSAPADLFRKEFEVEAHPVSARLYFSAQGLVQPYLNGASLGDEYLMPGWTAYQERLNLLTFDVTDHIRQGSNAIGLELADGWFRGKMGVMNQYDNYGTHTTTIAQLEIEMSDGSKKILGTDDSWRSSTSEVTFADIYDGCEIDFNKVQQGWAEPGFDDSGWNKAIVAEFDKSLLLSRYASGIRIVDKLPMTVTQKSDRFLLNAGQNIAGWVRLRVKGRKGDKVIVRHAEVLEPGELLHTKALRSAKATATYTLSHDGISVLEPKFTFHGFQYADVVADVEVVDAIAVAVSSATKVRSSFSSADTRLNKLHSNVVWSQMDNFVGLPTDCPQRDERLGWTGDAQAFSYAASTLFDTEAFWRSWLIDLEIDQDPVDGVPAVVPDMLKLQPEIGGWKTIGRAGWADAATIVPDAVYELFGSTQILRQQLNSMRSWVDSLQNRRDESGLLPTEFQFGDWCDPDAPDDMPWLAKVSSDFVANSFFSHSARLVAKFEKLVGDASMEKKYRALADEMAALTWKTLGKEAVKTTAGSAIALQFKICPVDQVEEVARNLAKIVSDENGKISTGFLGTPLILFALEDNGYTDEAYTMLLRREIRSWLYQVDSGATTIWERWDAIRADGSIHTGEMATENEHDHQEDESMISFNHYAYGAVIDWVYQYVAGIARHPDAPGYRKFKVSPRPTESLSYAEATIQSKYGALSIEWRLDGNKLQIELSSPFGTTGELDLALNDSSEVWVNGKLWDGSELGYGDYFITVYNPKIASV